MRKNSISRGISSRSVFSEGVVHQVDNLYQNTLLHPDERQITKGIKSTDVPAHLQALVDALVWESTRTEEGYVVLR
jgi:hypothetical protein